MNPLPITIAALAILAAGETQHPAQASSGLTWALVTATAVSALVPIVTRRGKRRLPSSWFLVPLGLFAAAILVADWYSVVRTWVPASIPLATRLLALAPFVVGALGTSRVAQMAQDAPGSWSAVLRSWRPALLFLLPFAALSGLYDLTWFVPEFRERLHTDPALLCVVSLCLSGVLLALSADCLRLIHPSRVLSPGDPLHDRLHLLARKARVRLREIRIWNTEDRPSIDARLAGVVGPLRVLYLSDEIVDRLRVEQVDQIVAHELAHARLYHVPISALLVATLVMAFLGGQSFLPEEALLGWGILVALTLLYLRLFFGAVSRSLEIQADHHGAQLTGSPVMFAATLVHVGELTGAMDSPGGWRHPSLARRVRYVLEATTGSALRRSLERRRRILLGILSVLFLGSAVLLGFELAQQPQRSAPEFQISRARHLIDERERGLDHPDWHLPRAIEYLSAAWEQIPAEERAGKITVLESLGLLLDEAEEFDRSARIRDQIRSLKAQLAVR